MIENTSNNKNVPNECYDNGVLRKECIDYTNDEELSKTDCYVLLKKGTLLYQGQYNENIMKIINEGKNIQINDKKEYFYYQGMRNDDKKYERYVGFYSSELKGPEGYAGFGLKKTGIVNKYKIKEDVYAMKVNDFVYSDEMDTCVCNFQHMYMGNPIKIRYTQYSTNDLIYYELAICEPWNYLEYVESIYENTDENNNKDNNRFITRNVYELNIKGGSYFAKKYLKYKKKYVIMKMKYNINT